MTQVIDGPKWFRCAGYRKPEVGELYISKSGKVTKSKGGTTDSVRLILRCFWCGEKGCDSIRHIK